MLQASSLTRLLDNLTLTIIVIKYNKVDYTSGSSKLNKNFSSKVITQFSIYPHLLF